MSSIVRVALVAEGYTDRAVVEAAIDALLEGRAYDLNLLQPEDPLATAPFGIQRPVGWSGVHRWCREAVERAGRLRDDILLMGYDVVILHLDADVAESNYAAAHIIDAPDPDDLPCVEECPPPSATTNALRTVMLRWGGETEVPERVILCTPSKSIEAWVLAALYPDEPPLKNGTIECLANPGNRLQAKPAKERLISGGKKNRARYEEKRESISAAWPSVREVCSEAERFSTDFLDCVHAGS